VNKDTRFQLNKRTGMEVIKPGCVIMDWLEVKEDYIIFFWHEFDIAHPQNLNCVLELSKEMFLFLL
jgi:hypothetical protein